MKNAGEVRERLARVLARAELVWDDDGQARDWMNSAHCELEGVAPQELAKTEAGARRVEELLAKLFYGLPA